MPRSLNSKSTHRLLTLKELLDKYPDSFFTEAGELIYDKKLNHFISLRMLRFLGKWHPGFRTDLYVEKPKRVTRPKISTVMSKELLEYRIKTFGWDLANYAYKDNKDTKNYTYKHKNVLLNK